MPSLGRRIPVDGRERSRSDPHTGRECRSPSNSSIRIPEMQETRSRVHMHCLHTARCTVRGCTHAVEPVHTSLLHGFPLTANAWPQSALAYCKQPHWPGHMWGGLVWRRMERLQKTNSQSSKQSSCEGCYQIFLFWVNAPWSTMSHIPPLTKFIHLWYQNIQIAAMKNFLHPILP